MKLKAETRFLNAIDSNIYDAGDTFEVKDEQAEYFVTHKLASKVKENTKFQSGGIFYDKSNNIESDKPEYVTPVNKPASKVKEEKVKEDTKELKEPVKTKAK